jgi:DNA polymerase III subunit delta'
LEEPPPQTLFLLVAENPEKILTTIMSRVQLTRIPPIENEFIAQVLKEKYELSINDANRIAMLSSGNYLKSLELAGNVQNEFLEPFRTWMGYCYQKKMAQALAWSDEYAGNGREQLKGFFLYSLEIIRAVLVSPYFSENQGLSEEETTFTLNFSKVIKTHAQTELMYDWFNDAAYEIERNGSAKIILTDLSFKIARILK